MSAGTAVLAPRLRQGATIGVVAPASPPLSPGSLENGLRALERMGFRVVRGTSLDGAHGYLSGSDETRSADINAMFADGRIDAVFCSRGGYGSGRILSMVDYAAIRRMPKIFMGYSDITALSMAMLKQTGLVTFSGPMVAADFAGELDAFTAKSMLDLLSKHRMTARMPVPAGARLRALSPGISEGRLLGGNMAVLMTLMGTPYEPSWDGAVLFLEDVAENVYKIDRMFSQFRNAGVLHRIAALLLGSFTGIPRDPRNRDLMDVLMEYAASLKIPVLVDVPFGHRSPKATLPMGARVRVNANRRIVTFIEPVVS